MQSMSPNLAVGWRFQPTNEELLDHYLKKKRLGQPIHGSDIQDIQIYNFYPWELLDEKSRDKERYLFYRRQFHQKTGGIQRKRKAKGGQWKSTGKIQSIRLEDSEEVIGSKTILVYHDPNRTEYVIHEFEYTAELDSPIQDDCDFVLCKLMIIKKKKKKASRKAKTKKVEPVSKKKEGKKSKNVRVEYEKTNPNKKARKCLSYCDKASVSVAENQKQEKIMASTFGEGEPNSHNTSDFVYQNPSDGKAYSACVEGEAINYMTSDFEDHSPVPMTTSSIYRKGESSHQGAFDYENQNTYNMIDIPIYNTGDTSFLLASDSDNQTPKEINDVWSYSLDETSGLVAADLDNQNPNEMTYMSSNEVLNPGCPSSSWVKNQNPCEITIVSTPKKGETSFTNFDFKDDRNQNKVISDSYNGKGKLSYLVTCDFENQNPSEKEEYEKTDMPYSEYCWSGSLASGVQETENQEVESHYKKTDIPNFDDVGVATFPEIDSQVLDELTALDDLLDTLSSEATQPIHPNESLDHRGFATSMSS